MGQGSGDDDGTTSPVFASTGRARARLAAALVVFAAVVALLFVTPLILGFVRGPSAPGVDLPQVERYDAVAQGAGPSLPRSGPSLMPLVVAAVLLVGLGGWFLRSSRSARRPTRGTVPIDRRARRARRTGRWWPAAILLALAVSGVALTAHIYSAGSTAGEGNRDDGVPAFAPDVGSVVDVGPTGVRSAHVRPGVVALTFDDGPDPRWTPQILAVLADRHVPATFFVIGEQATRHPELLRQVIRQGSEIGVHSYRHLETATQPPEEFRRDLRLTQLAIVGATGRSTALFRPPFVTRSSAVGLQRYLALRAAGDDGYISVLADRDSNDWRKPGAATIVERSLPRRGGGAIVELHDGGGDRRQTVQALGRLIDELRARGYRFATVSEVAHLSGAATMPESGGWEHLWGRSFLVAASVAASGSRWLVASLFALATIALFRMLLVAVAGWRHSRRRESSVREATTPAVSVIVAAYNEERTIAMTVAALGRSRGVDLQIVVVDDGSTDATARVVAALDDPRVELVVRPHEGKAAALAAGLSRCTRELVVTIDADTEVEPDTIHALVAPLADPSVGAVSGNLRVRSPRKLLGGAQHLEYVVGNAFERRTLDLLRVQVTVPGAAGAYRRRAIEPLGGFASATVAEDTDLTLALAAAGWDVRFAPGAVARTATPRTVRALWRQRSRWSFGIAQSLWRHRSMAKAIRSAPRAWFAWTQLALLQVVVPLAAPLLDFVFLWGLIAGVRFPVVLWVTVALGQFALTALALRIEGQSLRGLRAYPLLVLGYRHLTAAVVIQTVAWACAGRVPRWGTARVPVRVPSRVPSTARPTVVATGEATSGVPAAATQRDEAA